MSQVERTRVVILGGGVGGITAAFKLTGPEMAGRYEVTLYQMGWRLGGKGASGRNASASQRIEEHGLHIWLGFYHNAFTGMKACYEELGRSPDAPLGTFEKAFSPQSVGTLFDDTKHGWSAWNIPMPRTTDRPPGGAQPSPLAYAEMLVQWMIDALQSPVLLRALAVDALDDVRDVADRLIRATPASLAGAFSALREVGAAVGAGVAGLARDVREGFHPQGRATLEDALDAIRGAQAGTHPQNGVGAKAVVGAQSVQRWIHEMFERQEAQDDEVHHVAQLLDIAGAALVGLFEEGVLSRGVPFQALDDLELREFLTKYGCRAESLESPLIRGYYDLAFAFRQGQTDAAHQDAAAGTAIHAILRTCFEYDGAFMWRMEAGMGDTIFAPYYEVLKRRGVKFKFFHRVTALEGGHDPVTGALRVERVRLSRQVDVRGGDDAYQPLVDVKGLPSWPTEPLYDQIVQGDALRRGPNDEPYNLESYWSGWTDAGEVVLEPGDFDQVVLAIPVGAHPIVCADLMERSPRFRAMVQNVKTTQTFGVQLWLNRSMAEMGWTSPVVWSRAQEAVADAFADPMNSFADNSHLLPVEAWPAERSPTTLLYFCGALSDESPAGSYPPPSDTLFPARSAERVRRMAIDWLGKEWKPVFPRASDPGGGIDWSCLFDPQGREGAARFDAQFWRANVDPSERYTLSVARSTRHRLRAGDSQFAKLVLAGDWIDTGFNVGCVEAATLSGIQAASAVVARSPSGASKASGMPLFRKLPGDLELVPPFQFKKLQLQSYPLRADPARLQQIVDSLNIAPPEVCEFRAVGSRVFMQLAVYPFMQSEAQPDGWFKENELSFNILVLCGKRVNGVFVADSAAYHLPFVFVDTSFAIASGREVFGFPKAQSQMTFGAPGEAEVVSVNTLALPIDRPTEGARMVQLVTLRETEKLHGLSGLVTEGLGALEDVGRLLLGPDGLADQGTTSVMAMLKTLLRDRVGMVCLKQFRDAHQPDRACYQAVVRADFCIDRWVDASLLPGRFAVKILRDASFPIIEAFGLQTDAEGLIETDQAFSMTFDCTVTPGTNLYVAGR